MTHSARYAFAAWLAASSFGITAPAQEHMHHPMGEIPPVQAQFPRLGRVQEHPQAALFTLEQAEHMAGETNPTLRQADAEIRAAKGRQQQAALYPNPTVGYMADEVRGGSVGGGKQGFFVSQTVVTAGKLGLNRAVFGQEAKLAEIEAEEQRERVKSAVRMAFYRVLAAQELLDARQDLARIAEDAAETERRLMNTGQADESEVLEAEIEAQRMKISARMQENTLREEWRSLAAVLGRPELPLATVAGALDRDWPELNEEATVEAIAKQSPATRIAESAANRAQAVLARAKREPIPDLQLRAGAEYNNELLTGLPRATGWEAVAEVGFQIPLFNRNQGNVTAAQAEVERAQQEKKRVEFTLRDRAASAVDQYANARLLAIAYRDELLPRATKAYSLLVDKYGKMLASRPVVLDSQKTLYQLHMEYIGALESVWTNGIALQGFLLTDGLEAPARPGEMDRPVRETNVPAPERTLAPGESPVPRP